MGLCGELRKKKKPAKDQNENLNIPNIEQPKFDKDELIKEFELNLNNFEEKIFSLHKELEEKLNLDDSTDAEKLLSNMKLTTHQAVEYLIIIEEKIIFSNILEQNENIESFIEYIKERNEQIKDELNNEKEKLDEEIKELEKDVINLSSGDKKIITNFNKIIEHMKTIFVYLIINEEQRIKSQINGNNVYNKISIKSIKEQIKENSPNALREKLQQIQINFWLNDFLMWKYMLLIFENIQQNEDIINFIKEVNKEIKENFNNKNIEQIKSNIDELKKNFESLLDYLIGIAKQRNKDSELKLKNKYGNEQVLSVKEKYEELFEQKRRYLKIFEKSKMYFEIIEQDEDIINIIKQVNKEIKENSNDKNIEQIKSKIDELKNKFDLKLLNLKANINSIIKKAKIEIKFNNNKPAAKELLLKLYLIFFLTRQTKNLLLILEDQKMSLEQKSKIKYNIDSIKQKNDSLIGIISSDESEQLFVLCKELGITIQYIINGKNKEAKEEKKEINNKKKNILDKQKEFRLNNPNKSQFIKEEEVKEILEDMCAIGSIMKKEIIENKKNNPEKFIPIEKALSDKNNKEIFCLGVLAQSLENIGIETAIEKNPINDEDSQNASNTILQFITNGLINKNKYNFHFDFGEERNNELLTNINEQKAFNDKLRKKLSIEYNIPENQIILTNPQKGSYEIQVIFETNEFNQIDISNIDIFKSKCQNDNDFKELCYLKKIHKSLIMEGCMLSQNMLDAEGNRESGWEVGGKRGGLPYTPPQGWKGFGLKVKGKYDNGNDDWISCNGNKNEWAVAYHGIGTGLGMSLEKATNNIIKGGFKAGSGQKYEFHDDANHPGQKVGRGVYCSPNPDVMDSYAQTTNKIGKTFKMGFMMRVKPDRIRYSNSKPDYWVLDGTTQEMRPYRIMIKEDN